MRRLSFVHHACAHEGHMDHTVVDWTSQLDSQMGHIQIMHGSGVTAVGQTGMTPQLITLRSNCYANKYLWTPLPYLDKPTHFRHATSCHFGDHQYNNHLRGEVTRDPRKRRV